MGFIVSKRSMLGGDSGFVLPDYRMRKASGYPITLKKALEIREITVRGNYGGTGDKTLNLFDIDEISQNMTKLSNTYPNTGRYFMKLEPNTEYTFWNDKPRYDGEGNVQRTLTVKEGRSSSVQYETDGVWLNQMRTVTTDSNGWLTVFTARSSKTDLWQITECAQSRQYRFMMVKGRFDLDTIMPYEPFGYKISISNGSGWSFSLYNTKVLEETEEITAKIKDKAALVTTQEQETDISYMQDWKQNVVFSRTEEMTITADTAVPPSNIAIKYIGKRI